MKYKAVIEIPKGCDRRIHFKYDGSGFEDFGPIKEKIPVNDGIIPIAYGYIENAINKKEKDNVDVIIFSNKQFKTGDETDVEVIGLLEREDEDHKIIAVDDSVSYKRFSEVLVDERKLIIDYFGYHHKITVQNIEEALEYLAECTVS